MTRISNRKFGPKGRKLGELSDKELRQELLRRRGAEPGGGESQPTWKRVRQYLANLELSPGATWPEVERAYRRLLEQYHPDKHEGDVDRHRTAQELTDSLTRAYQALKRYFTSAD